MRFLKSAGRQCLYCTDLDSANVTQAGRSARLHASPWDSLPYDQLAELLAPDDPAGGRGSLVGDSCPLATAGWLAGPLPPDWPPRGVDLSTPFDAAVDAQQQQQLYWPTGDHFRGCGRRSDFLVGINDEDDPAAAAAQKYFHEVPGYGHVDARYYRGPRPRAYRGPGGRLRFEKPAGVARERTRAELRALHAGWAEFAAAHGVTAWLGHGALLGWFWTGRLLPWDDDVDLQMTLHDLARLAAAHNMTAVGGDGGGGGGRFVVDVNPNAAVRRHQRANIVDARFVDTKTGRFIDITALASPLPPFADGGDSDDGEAAGARGPRPDLAVACKSVHAYPVGELFPLRRSTFEGSPCLVPFDVRAVLTSEYGNASWARPAYRDYVFDERAREWVRVSWWRRTLVRYGLAPPFH
ncbi:hypothetical protein HK405_008381 [Cladochytrium tenue]|nr:hypothetical protein HK405_008381 [Cladochytrium tenue]